MGIITIFQKPTLKSPPLLRSRTDEKACGAARPTTLGLLPHQGQGHGPCLRAEPKAEAVQTVQQRR